MSPNTLKVVTVKNPLTREHSETKTTEFLGHSIGHLVRVNVPKGVDVTVTLNGGIVPKDRWSIIPKEGDCIAIIPILE